MATDARRFGTDLRLLVDVGATHQLRRRGADLVVADEHGPRPGDVELMDGVDNLAQALLLRFLTEAGELEALGHPTYGSQLHTLIGELNSQTNRNRAKMFVLRALAEEPRVKEVMSVDVRPNSALRERIDIAVRLVAVDGDTPLNLVFPFFLEGGA